MPMTTQTIDQRYSDLTDRRLATRLTEEDRREYAGLNPFERLTCHVHRRWLHDCVSSPAHVNMISGHRWCRRCESTANVSIDHVTGAVNVVCPRCHCSPNTLATRQIIRACKASLAIAHDRTEQPCTAGANDPCARPPGSATVVRRRRWGG